MEDMRRGVQATSPFHTYLSELFKARVDVQWTTGRLNYINGYTTKAHDAMDFTIDATSTTCTKTQRWLTAYRLLCKKTVCIPETVLWFREAPPMVRSCRIGKCYAPIPLVGEKENDTERLYAEYLRDDTIPKECFLAYCRIYRWGSGRRITL